VAAHRLFDYWLPAGLAVGRGSVLVVKLGARSLAGVVVELSDTAGIAPDRVIPIDRVIPGIPPLPDDLLELASFIAGYYQQPIGLCLAQMLPPLIAAGATRAPLAARYRMTEAGRSGSAGARGRGLTMRTLLGSEHGASTAEIRALGAHSWRLFGAWRRDSWIEPVAAKAIPSPHALALNPDQRAALVAALPEQGGFQASLLQGVTGSGKTAVYLEAARKVIGAGRQALLLVPEIGLTPQLEQRVADALPGTRIAMLHSRLGSSERRRQWLAAASGEAQLIVGTRLAVFAPAPDLGLIVVDEEHDASFKQHEGVRYHARDVAIYRGSRRDVPVLLGSATPSLETYAQAMRGRYRWLKLPLRATAHTALPPVRLVPTRGEGAIEGIGPALRQAISDRLARREQSLLFINRRGYAPALLCPGCGWKAPCPRCAARLVVHRVTAAAFLPELRQSGPAAARIGHAAPRARARQAVSGGEDPAHRSRQHPGQTDIRDNARGRRCRRSRHPGRHANAGQGTRLRAPDAGRRPRRRQRAVQRRISSDRAPVRAARAGRWASRPPRSVRRSAGADRFSAAPAVRRARRPRFRPLRGELARRARGACAASVRTSGAAAGRGASARTAADISRRRVRAGAAACRRGGKRL